MNITKYFIVAASAYLGVKLFELVFFLAIQASAVLSARPVPFDYVFTFAIDLNTVRAALLGLIFSVWTAAAVMLAFGYLFLPLIKSNRA